ncbi:hypothetical protein P0E69_23075 (plasmid) [Chimaeribacter arupi]|uniref:hypothetical protein n=1 Tax=Chimaeribacter arupi TaxID=2060066 RepID=UPI0027121BEC|nr:hypothetical protein [Chimaeribacter arupi]WKZ94982.1 hypothetical protein P0E69_23075 [Chimaeribacter arupi]
MNTLAITIGITLFLMLVIFMAYSVYNIRKSAKLKSFYKKLLWVGLGILFVLAISSKTVPEFHVFMSLVLMNYIKAMYFSVVGFGFFYICKSIYKKIKTIITKIKVRAA